VVLYDLHAAASIAGPTADVTSSSVREGAFLSCAAPVDVGKYLRRRSAWEAHVCLEIARNELWKRVAISLGVRHPEFGVTSILDFAPELIPTSLRATVAGLDLEVIAAAGKPTAEFRAHTARRLCPPWAGERPLSGSAAPRGHRGGAGTSADAGWST